VVRFPGAHTIGQTRCSTFVQDRFAISGNNPFPDTNYGQQIYEYCLEGTTEGIDRKVALDSNTTTTFDNAYFQSIIDGRGVLVSDNDLYVDPRTIALVKLYAADQDAFFAAFAESLHKMSKLGVLTGTQGQIRTQCWVRNSIDKVSSPFSDFDFDPISPTICTPASSDATPTCATN
jgi:peroxidase